MRTGDGPEARVVRTLPKVARPGGSGAEMQLQADPESLTLTPPFLAGRGAR